MKKKIVSTLVVIGLLIVLGGYSYNVQYRQKLEIKHFTAFFSVTAPAHRYEYCHTHPRLSLAMSPQNWDVDILHLLS